MKTIRSLLLALAAATLMLGAPAWAQDFPTKPVTIYCPWPAGGTTDQYFRAFAQQGEVLRDCATPVFKIAGAHPLLLEHADRQGRR